MIEVKSIKLLTSIDCRMFEWLLLLWSSMTSKMSENSTLNTDIDSARDTEKNEERRRFDCSIKKTEEEKEDISIFDERERNLWILRADDFDNELLLKLKDRNLEFANVTR